MPRRAGCAEQQAFPLPEPSISWNAWPVCRPARPVPISSRCKLEPSTRSQSILGCHPRPLSQLDSRVAAGCSKASPRQEVEARLTRAGRRRKRENVHLIGLVRQAGCNERRPTTWQRLHQAKGRLPQLLLPFPFRTFASGTRGRSGEHAPCFFSRHTGRPEASALWERRPGSVQGVQNYETQPSWPAGLPSPPGQDILMCKPLERLSRYHNGLWRYRIECYKR